MPGAGAGRGGCTFGGGFGGGSKFAIGDTPGAGDAVDETISATCATCDDIAFTGGAFATNPPSSCPPVFSASMVSLL